MSDAVAPVRQFIVAGNWKMHGSRDMIGSYCETLRAGWSQAIGTTPPPSVLLFPSYCHLERLRAGLGELPVEVGAQSVHAEVAGAFTGETAAAMIRDLGVGWTLVGHSERRTLYGETDAVVAGKLRAALAAELKPVLCVGETLDQRRSGAAEARVEQQLATAIAAVDAGLVARLVVAYEPVWAIGTGETATPEIAQAMHECIRRVLADRLGPAGAGCPVLYGGSVTEQNAAALFAQPDIDGGLVGGAALEAPRFLQIIAAAAKRGSKP
jgi:triosephosphate isomerase